MWQIYGEKVTCGTKGGLANKFKQSMKLVVTTNGEKSAEVIVPRKKTWEGPNNSNCRIVMYVPNICPTECETEA